MIEVRTIQRDEAKTFLRILCCVFDLDFRRAESVFFSEPFFDLRRKWALFEDGEMHAILTTTPLTFGWGKAIGIAGVATPKEHRRRGLAQMLLERVLEEAEGSDEGPAMLFAHRVELYQRLGFEVLDEVVVGLIESDLVEDVPDPLTYEHVRRTYDAWAMKDPARLRRDERRWSYWQFVTRVCEPFDDGYLCTEPSLCREAVIGSPQSQWPVAPGTRWSGLASMVKLLEVPVIRPTMELMLMGRRCPSTPQMFMTDQF